jgi:putative transposase
MSDSKLDYHMPFYYKQFYHVYNKAAGNDQMFFCKENYNYFLKKYSFYLSNLVETYSFCLLPNHFHLLIKPIVDDSNLVSEKFRRFFISYTLAINKQQNRKGDLFQRHFKRKLINNDNYLINAVHYIHANPEHHHISNDFRNYVYSSYKLLLNKNSTRLNKEEVLCWFGGVKGYLDYHCKLEHSSLDNDFSIED